MTGLHFLLLAVALCTSGGAASAASVQSQPDPANRPASAPKPTPLAGPDGTRGMAILGAMVNSDGTLVSGAGVTSSFLISGSVGEYEIDFNRDVSSCIYNVSPYLSGYNLYVEPRLFNGSGVYVGSKDKSGNYISGSFYLSVLCSK